MGGGECNGPSANILYKTAVFAITVLLMAGCFAVFSAEYTPEQNGFADETGDSGVVSSNVAVYGAETPTSYQIYVDGEQITSENKDNLYDGTVTYDPETHTLFLKNAVLDRGTLSDYAIKTIIPGVLTINLSGTNTITRTYEYGGMGISSSESVLITGNGTLTINCSGANYDGISVAKDLTIANKANLVINSTGGCGIVANGTVTIDGVVLDSTGLYVGIDAHELKITNGSEVTLCATEANRNAAYVWKADGSETGGNIEITASTVNATSYYPALFADTDIVLDNSNIDCTSTDDSAIWSKGNLTVKGGTILNLDTKFAAGCLDTFTIEKAEINVKNTGSEEVPAIVGRINLVIAEGYEIKSAKTVNSEGVEEDLLPGDIETIVSHSNVKLVTKAINEPIDEVPGTESSDSKILYVIIGAIAVVCVGGFTAYWFVIRK